MEGKDEREERKSGNPLTDDASGGGENPEDPAPRSSPTWRGLVVSVVAAIVLAVAATLLLGGSFGLAGGTSPGGCGPGSACCPPAGEQAKAAR